MFWLTVCLHGVAGLFPNPLPNLAKDWVKPTPEQPRIGYYKHIKVLGSGDRAYLLNLNTDRGVVRNVRATLIPGSFWKDVTINSEGKVTRRELSKSRDTGCLESAVIMRRTGIVEIGGMQVTDAQGNFFGNIDLVNCEKKNKD
ncbi:MULTISPECIES: hypothetical protein [unclassified Dolichospermum]|uniref:hypothetical protein n=1 Tax=unclassified Dolichospermum TaxID=2622029 RepID=UPI001447AFEB|nr:MULTISPECIES: hypothetical protein [unclassified Dolichospermum]MTJ17983.1 hypothetical protein [Dolichospermum sp. UHCC 0299]MTJ40693.1 hypothetical protein [Dolichospermum sp. UHCC 0406]